MFITNEQYTGECNSTCLYFSRLLHLYCGNLLLHQIVLYHTGVKLRKSSNVGRTFLSQYDQVQNIIITVTEVNYNQIPNYKLHIKIILEDKHVFTVHDAGRRSIEHVHLIRQL